MKKNQILLAHGTDYREMARAVMEASGLTEEYPDRSIRIGLKPNLVVAAPASTGATTHPELIAGVIEYFQQNGYENLCVLEGSWVGDRTDRAYRVSGIDAVCRQYGVPYYDLQKDSSVRVDAHGMKLKICSRVKELDLLINMPVVKGHCQTNVTCALKNCKGLIPNDEKRRFHAMGLHDPIGHLITAMPPMFCLADNICGDLDFEEGGNPVYMNRVIGCKDPVLCDAFACASLGWDIADVPYIGIAEALGAGSSDLSQAEVVMLNAAEPSRPAQASHRVRELARFTAPKEACSACYGSLIHALNRLCAEGCTPPDHICIGQGYRGESGELGVGSCCAGCKDFVRGCPPTAEDVIRFLRAHA